MCGNVGIINREKDLYSSSSLVKYFKQAIIVDSIRGLDGTGVLAIKDNRKTVVHKKGCASQEFLQDLQVGSTLSAHNNLILCGHNRAATKGSLNDSGAHPFIKGDITLFHNGTLDYWSTLSKDVYDIDSEAICAGISENGAIDTLEKLSGAYALIWYNKKDDTINFARNNERPLYFATLKNSNSLLYASEKGMIEWLADKNKIAIKEIKSLDVGKLLTMPISENKKAKITKFKIKATSYYPYTDYDTYSYNKAEDIKYNYLRGSTIPVKLTKFISYGGAYAYGCIEGYYKDCLGNRINVSVSGQRQNIASKLVNSPDYTIVKVASVNKQNILWCSLLNKKEISMIDIESELLSADNLTKSNLKVGGEVIDINTKKNLPALVDQQKNGAGGYIGPFGLKLSKKDFIKKLKGGCNMCNKKLSPSEQEDIVWLDCDSPTCLSCVYEVI